MASEFSQTGIMELILNMMEVLPQAISHATKAEITGARLFSTLLYGESQVISLNVR